MPRSNANAGQKNRPAQKGRAIRRRVLSSQHRSEFQAKKQADRLVLGPSSKELLTRTPIIVREKETVAA